MFATGAISATIGLLLFHMSLGMTLRANRARRVAFHRNAATVPAGSVPLRAAGAGLLVLGAVLLSSADWWWPIVVVFAGPVAALLAILVHNRRIDRAVRLGSVSGIAPVASGGRARRGG